MKETIRKTRSATRSQFQRVKITSKREEDTDASPIQLEIPALVPLDPIVKMKEHDVNVKKLLPRAEKDKGL